MERGRVREVFLVFLRLGLTSFGGPVAHVAYFQAEFCNRRRWLTPAQYAEIVGLCQFLPGPASSQIGFSLGLLRAGLGGALAAWLAFTTPSALLMLSLAFAGPALLRTDFGSHAAQGLQTAAVAVVAQAIWRLGRVLCPEQRSASIAILSAILMLLGGRPSLQVVIIAAGAVAGVVLLTAKSQSVEEAIPLTTVGRHGAYLALGTFIVLLLLPPALLAVYPNGWLAFLYAFYRAGALVFGGGHVVLPLLESTVANPGWVSQQQFLAGYGATQALPGPLFSFAAYLGALSKQPPNGIFGGVLALLAIFLPGLLLITGALPFWSALRQYRQARAAMAGVGAAVVGLLMAAFYNPVWISSITSPASLAIALAAFLLLEIWKVPPWTIVLLCGVAGGLGAFR